MWQSVTEDIRYSLRAWRAKPGLTAAALLTLALGIGANTAIFSAVHAVLIRDLPYPAPDRLVQVYESNRRLNFDHGVVNPFNLDTWQRESRVFSHLAPFQMWMSTLTGLGDAERVRAPRVDATFFEALGVPPMSGRVFTAAEAEAGAMVTVISHDTWRTRFGSDPAVVGRAVMLGDDPFQVIGIMPAGFKVPDRAEFWLPLHLTPAMRASMTSSFLGVIGRLRPGATVADAQRDLSAVSSRLEAQFPAERKDRGAHVVNLHEDMTAQVVDGLAQLQVVVIVVLLIACANLANLQLAQASARGREFAVRSAVGAGRGRLIRQLLTESVLLALAGGTLGTCVAVVGVAALTAAAPERFLPAFATISVSLPALAFTLGLSATCGIVFGVAPAVLFSRPSCVTTLRDDSLASTGSGRPRLRWLRSGLVVAEVALALTLCFGAALLVRSVVTLSRQDTGFRAERLLTASITLPPRYKAPEARRAFWEQLIERLNTSAGVTGVAGSTALPFSNWEWQTTFEAADLPDLKNGRSSIRAITAGYFGQLGIPVLDGREFGSDDHASAEPVAIVNEVFARRFFSGRSPVGQRVRTNTKGGPWITVIGVTTSTRHTRLDEDPMPELYRPISQTPEALLTIAVRAKGAAESIAPVLYAAVRDIDVSVPLEQVKPMDVLIGETVAVRRFYMRLLSAFAALAGILTLVGIYGVTSYVVSLRTREIGIRVALGATPLAVQGQIVRQGVRPILAGLVIGGGIVAFAAQLIENQLFGVTTHDPATFALTASALLIVGTMACLAPARRCARVSLRTGLRR